jgi:hypothetical protein
MSMEKNVPWELPYQPFSMGGLIFLLDPEITTMPAFRQNTNFFAVSLCVIKLLSYWVNNTFAKQQ